MGLKMLARDAVQDMHLKNGNVRTGSGLFSNFAHSLRT